MQGTLSGAEGPIWASHHNPVPTIISPRSHIHWLPEGLAGTCDLEVERFIFLFHIFLVVQHFLYNSMPIFLSVRKD